MKRYKGEILFEGVLYSVVMIMALCSLLPLLHVAALSLSSKTAVDGGHVSFLPVEWTIAPYQYIMQDGQYLESFGVSVLRTVVGTLIQLCTTIMMAYHSMWSMTLLRMSHCSGMLAFQLFSLN